MTYFTMHISLASLHYNKLTRAPQRRSCAWLIICIVGAPQHAAHQLSSLHMLLLDVRPPPPPPRAPPAPQRLPRPFLRAVVSCIRRVRDR